jgi:hypothetical protein
MKTKNSMALVLCSSLLIAASGVQAGDRSGDALLGGLFGGGVGAVIGNQVGGRDGAIIGGALGAATGVAITTDRGSRGYRGERYVAAPVYMAPRPVVYYNQPYYSPRVIYVEPRGRGYYRRHHEFRHDRDEWDNHDGWRGGRHGRRDWD